MLLCLQHFIRISIHAPAEGATGDCDGIEVDYLFQSTLPRRERHGLFRHASFDFLYFNPRSRGGSDLLRLTNYLTIASFQSTLPRRERQTAE